MASNSLQLGTYQAATPVASAKAHHSNEACHLPTHMHDPNPRSETGAGKAIKGG